MSRVSDLEISETSLGPLAWLTLRGPRRQVFRHLGETFGDVITAFLAGASERKRATRMRKSPHLATVLETTRRMFPGPVSELEAMAEGADVPANELLWLNIRGDLGYENNGCSDLGLRSQTRLLLVHNEDADPVHEGDCPLLTLHIDGDLPVTTYWYPGMMATMTFWLNGSGIACGIDHIPVANPGAGVGRQFLARRLAGATSLAEFVDWAGQVPVAGGYTYMVGSAQERQLLTVEVGPSGISAGAVAHRYAHTNHFLALTEQQVIDEQSLPRLEKLNSLDEPSNRDEALRAFSDPAMGIWRDATGGDPLLTLCSALFDFDHRVVMLHPRGATEDHRLSFEEFIPSL
ncbi:MAG: C45 family autoproteolytic acyltransferase/hydrolase [Acidimicrobiia bacterium]